LSGSSVWFFLRPPGNTFRADIVVYDERGNPSVAISVRFARSGAERLHRLQVPTPEPWATVLTPASPAESPIGSAPLRMRWRHKPRGEHHFIRRGITIPDVRANSDKTVRALIVIDDQALSTFLGDAENPAHADWSERADRIRTFYDHGASTLRFVKNSASFLASLLARPQEGRVHDFLADIFSIEIDDEPQHQNDHARIAIRAAAGENAEGAATNATAGSSVGITIARIAGGFTIKASSAKLIGRRLRGEVAYRVRAGNSFRKHSPFDFDLLSDNITVTTDGALLRPTSGNSFELLPSAPKFQLSMKGFDSRRDLVVRLIDADDAAETELH
jgi:hypothetical protein